MPGLISFRAGRAERRGTTSWVDPQPGRGLVSVEQSNDDGLLHFIYKDLESNNTIDDLILFPGDATFAPVSNARRVYVLRFTSSSARHFYWMQDVADDQDSRRASRVNALIDDPSASEDAPASQSQDTDMSSASAPAASSSQPAPSSSSSPTDSNPPPSYSSSSNITQEQMAQLQALIQRSGQSSGSSYGGPSVSLADILSPSRLLSLLHSNPSIAESLYAYLPPASETVPHNLETLKAVFTSPEVRKSARGLDQALSTGALGPLAYGLGLKEDETFGVDNYLKGVQRLGDEEKGKSSGDPGNAMQTD